MSPIRTHDVEALSAALRDTPNLEAVRLAFFGREGAPSSPGVLQVAEEVARATRGRVALDAYDLDEHPWVARRCRVRHAPCLSVAGAEGDTGLRFYGSLEGFGAAGLAAAIRLAAGADAGLAPGRRAQLGELVAPATLRLFVDHYDAAVPELVRAVAAVAIASPLLRADILNAQDFRELARISGAVTLPTLLLGGRRLPLGPEEDALAREVLRASLVAR